MQGSRAGPHRQQFWPGPGAQGNINLQGYPSLAFTCLKLFQNLATEIQVIIKYTLLEHKSSFVPLLLFGEKLVVRLWACLF